MIIGTFNSMNIVALPCDSVPGVTAPSSIEWDTQEAVAANVSPFTGATQTYDWQASWLEGQVSFPAMSRYSYDAWSAFVAECRGQLNCFQLGDPKAVYPKGSALGSPVVNGAAQTGYSLVTRGWTANSTGLLLFGDYIQIEYRLYRVLDNVTSDGSGNATISVWPNLRDQPADGTAIITRNCKGLFRLAANSGNKFSVNATSYGSAGFKIREAI